MGLYGHVVPIKLLDPRLFAQEPASIENEHAKTYFKVEYWQFFGYNTPHQSGEADTAGTARIRPLLPNAEELPF